VSSAARGAIDFPRSARTELANVQLRRNLAKATGTIRAKQAAAAGELPDWQALRDAGAAIKHDVVTHLDTYLEAFDGAAAAAGARVHWARDADECNGVVAGLLRELGAAEAVKVKSLTTDEIRLNDALAAAGVEAVETDFAELILQLDRDWSSHILVPAIHRNRREIRDLLRRTIGPADLSDEPRELAEAARRHLRARFLRAPVGISGANFAIAETGTLVVLESEGNGRMCTTLPPALISIVGIEKLLPTFDDLEVFLQLLPRSATGERMNPYTSLWTGVTPGDGPQRLDIVLLDNGRSDVLADPAGRDALRCIRCSACLNVCPVYERTGGHAYGSIYPGPIGAILTPQLEGVARAASLPYASSLCGACYEVCPVKIDIPRILVHLRGEAPKPGRERRAMRWLARLFADARRYERGQRLGRLASRALARRGAIRRAPGLGGWTQSRDLPPVAPQTFREWWRERGA
jgi:L-lactate dehydrogenase complex protein LldF